MKITKEELKQIVKEELDNVLSENKALNDQVIANITRELDKADDASLRPGTIAMLKDLIKGYLTGIRKMPRGLKALRGAKPLGQIEKSVVVTGAKG